MSEMLEFSTTMSNINEIRCRKSVYEFDFKNFSNLIINTFKFQLKICALIITILAKIIGLIYFVTIFMAFVTFLIKDSLCLLL